MDLAYTLHPAFLFFLLLLVVLLSAEVGFHFGRWIVRNREPGENTLFDVVEGGVLGLVGLILAFSFSLAITRFEDRQHLVVTEANAIDTAYLRASFLPATRRDALEGDLREYLQTRLTLYQTYRSTSAREPSLRESLALQERMWKTVASAVNANPQNHAIQLLAEAVNQTIDAGREQQAALDNRVPGEIAALLIVVAVVAAGLLGYGFGINIAPRRVMTVIFCLLITMIVYTIFDLDRPQSGLITVNLGPLRSVAGAMSH